MLHRLFYHSAFSNERGGINLLSILWNVLYVIAIVAVILLTGCQKVEYTIPDPFTGRSFYQSSSRSGAGIQFHQNNKMILYSLASESCINNLHWKLDGKNITLDFGYGPSVYQWRKISQSDGIAIVLNNRDLGTNLSLFPSRKSWVCNAK